MTGLGKKLFTPNGAYLLDRVLGSGFTSVVYLATQTSPPARANRQVAIKVGVSNSAELHKRFEREAENLQRLEQAAVSAVPRLLDEKWPPTPREGEPFLILELIEGRKVLDEANLQEPFGRLPEPRALEVGLSYARLLEGLHAAGLSESDRKLDDLLWVDEPGSDLDGWSRQPGLVVLDWNVVGGGREDDQRSNILLFGTFFYRLLLGEEVKVGPGRRFVGIEDDPDWDTLSEKWRRLSLGTRTILGQTLSRGVSKQLAHASRLVAKLEKQVRHLQEDPKQLLRQGRELLAGDPEQALMILDVLRAHHPAEWTGEAQTLARQARNRILEEWELLFKRVRTSLLSGQEQGALEVMARLEREAAGDPEKALKVERWRRMTRFVADLPLPQWNLLGPEEERGPLARLIGTEGAESRPGVLGNLESRRFHGAAEGFWTALRRVVERAQPPPPVVERWHQVIDWVEQQWWSGKTTRARRTLLRSVGKLLSADADLSGLFETLLDGEGGLLWLLDEAVLRARVEEAEALLDQLRLEEAREQYQEAGELFEDLPYRGQLHAAGLVSEFDQVLRVCEEYRGLERAREEWELGSQYMDEAKRLSSLALLDEAEALFWRALARLQLMPDTPQWVRLPLRRIRRDLQRSVLRVRDTISFLEASLEGKFPIWRRLKGGGLREPDPWVVETSSQLPEQLAEAIQHALIRNRDPRSGLVLPPPPEDPAPEQNGAWAG